MGKNRAVTRTRFPGGERRRPKRDHDVVAKERIEARLSKNWRVVRADDYEVLALEPGREHEQVFDGADPFWDAVQFAASYLRGEVEPDA